jgi:hypothetical protein
MDSIYDILHRLDAISEDIGPEQRKVKQLPALFQPPQTSPQLDGPYPGQNATRGYLVGEAEEIEEGDVVAFSKAGMTDVKDEQDYLDKRDRIYKFLTQPNLDVETKAAAKERLKELELAARNAGVVKEEQLDEAATTEDVLSTMKKKLGDYLQDVATAIRTDPDLKDKVPQTIDQVKAVKTITTDDGKEIKILGNEDDGFRISIRNKAMKTPFKSLDEAVMACEMYCARRRMVEPNADYVEEKRS